MIKYSSYKIPPRLMLTQFTIPIIDDELQLPVTPNNYFIKITTPEKVYTVTPYNKLINNTGLQIIVNLGKVITGTIQLEVYTYKGASHPGEVVSDPVPGFNNLVFKGYASDQKETEIEVKTPDLKENTIIYDPE